MSRGISQSFFPFNRLNILSSVAVAVTLLLTACATTSTPRDPPPSAEEVTAATNAAAACLKLWVEKLDDGISPANVVGYQVGEQCSREILTTVTLKFPDRGREEAGVIMPMFPRLKGDAGTSVVLTARKMRASEARSNSRASSSESSEMKQLGDCLVREVAQLDDRVSPASVIGHRVGQSCAREFLALAETHLPNRDLENIQRAEKVAVEAEDQFGTDAVVSARKGEPGWRKSP